MNRQCEARDEAKEKKDKAAEKNACENISNTLFYLAVTLAHEIYHCWFGFLVGYADLYTPMFTDFPLPDYDPAKPEDYEDAEGESGSWFESKLMEGLIFMLENTTDILKLDQSGTPYLADEAGRCFKVSREFVDNVNNDSKSRGLTLLHGCARHFARRPQSWIAVTDHRRTKPSPYIGWSSRKSQGK